MNNKSGFLLIEMLVALLLSCILMGVATGYLGHACAQSRKGHCVLQAIQKALEWPLSHDQTPQAGFSAELTECSYTQQILPSCYAPVSSDAFRIMTLTIVTNYSKKPVPCFSLLLGRSTP